jgi:DNA-binding LacI/PurR family transcriptional regulator
MNSPRRRADRQVHRAPSPTLEDLAVAAGVSRSTASRAINGGERVSAAAQAAVDRAVADLGYIPNRAARSLVTRRTSSIALVIPEPDVRVMVDPFFAVVITGVTEALRETDVQLVLLMSRTGGDSTRTLRYLRGGHVDGAIVVSHHEGDAWARSLAETGLPTIFIGRPWDTTSKVTYVDTDNVQGGRLAALHLAGIGRRHLATVAGPADMTAAVDRLRGWEAGLADSGIEGGRVVHADFTTEGAAVAARRLLAEDPEIDGIFAASDLMALGVLEAIQAAGRTVPGDVALMGYDNHAVAETAATPLTSITQSIMRMAVQAGVMLLEEIEAPGSHPEPVIYSTELVERASTSTAPSASAVNA